MSGFKPVPGNEFLLHGQWHRVETYNRVDGYIVAVDKDGALTIFTIEDLAHHPALTVPGQRRSLVDMSGQVSEHDRQLVLLRIAEVQEVLTGYRSGRPEDALPNEPRPEFDPALTTKKARYLAKAAELAAPSYAELGLKMSVSTMRRIEDAIKRGESVAHSLGKHKPRRSGGRRAMTPEFENATREMLANRKKGSTVRFETMWADTLALLLVKYGKEWLEHEDTKKPSFSTWRRWLGDHYTRSELNGRASTRATSTVAPRGGFNRTNLSRLGELVIMDTNNLDTLLEGTALAGVVRGSLVAAIDGYSWSCVAIRVVEQVETAVDVAMTFLDIGRPMQMDPKWGDDYRWPFVGLPEHVLGTIGGIKNVAGIPVVNPEAIAIDHGNTYKSRKIRDLAEKYDFDILPARVRMGSDKAPVERFFGALRSMLLEHLKGYRGSHPGERGENVDAEVEWTAQSLQDLITRWVILEWQTHIIDGHKPAWCPEGDWSPNDLYQHALRTNGFNPTLLGSEDYFAALRTTAVRMHSRGVNINGLWYDDDALFGQWRNKPAPTGTKKWTVQADERDLRTVWWVDPDGERHEIRWTGIGTDMPAFCKRHVKALRQRLGNIERYDSRELAVVLLTKVLPLPDENGQWSTEERKANAAASRHNREVELVAQDQAKAGVARPQPEPVAETAQPETTRTKHEKSVEAARKAQRAKALSGAKEIEAAPELGTRKSGLLSGYYDEDGAA